MLAIFVQLLSVKPRSSGALSGTAGKETIKTFIQEATNSHLLLIHLLLEHLCYALAPCGEGCFIMALLFIVFLLQKNTGMFPVQWYTGQEMPR